MNDLELEKTDALLDELFMRFDNAVFSGIVKRTDSSNTYRHKWKGDSYVCMGLCTEAINNIHTNQSKRGT